MSALEAAEKAAPTRPPLRSETGSYQLLAAISIVASVLLVAFFVHGTRDAEVRASTQLGRIYGLVGSLILIFLAAYGVRRYSYRAGLFPLEWWYRAHLLLGAPALALLGAHSGFAMRSAFLAGLQISFWGTVLTGVLGWIFQTVFKNWMLKHEYRPTVLKEVEYGIDSIRGRLAALARESGDTAGADGASLKEALGRATQRLETTRRQNIWRFPDLRFWEEQVDALESASGLDQAAPDAKLLLARMNHLQVLRSYHRCMRAWTTIHFLFTFAAVQLMVWHVVIVGLNPR